MRRQWLIVALGIPLFAGCFEAHTNVDGEVPGEDAGVMPPPFDGGGAECRETFEAFVQELRCPTTAEAGGFAYVEVDLTPPWCCSSGALRAEFRPVSSNRFEAYVGWTACDCCDGCRCIGPIETIAHEIGPLAPGTNTFSAYGATCTIEALAPSECRSVPVTNVLVPEHLIEGQQLSVTLASTEVSGCSCTPRVATSVVAERYSLDLEACDCCDECDCIDPGYRSSTVLPVPPLGTHVVTLPTGEHEITMHARSECYEVTASSVEVLPPDDSLITTGPRLSWARVTGQTLVCCSVPAPAVEQTTLADGTIELRLLSCELDPCDCDPGTPAPVEAWHSLGELAPGTYTLRAGTVATSFIVP